MLGAVLVLNSGSSSIKFMLFDAATEVKILRGEIMNVSRDAEFFVKIGEDIIRKAIGSILHMDAIKYIFDFIVNNTESKICAVGHRVVHGGNIFSSAVLINEKGISLLEDLIPLAPLHQAYNLEGIKFFQNYDANIKQIACFDTAFHQTQQMVARQYGIPYCYFDKGIKKYGFHGLSYQYISSVLPLHLGEMAYGRIIVLHLGNGASVCAMKDLKSVASTMGFTALDGLMMGTRCGSIDPGVILYFLENNLMNLNELTHMLYYESGLKGVSGVSHDMRELIASDDKHAKDAIELFCYSAAQHLSSLIPAINGLDSVVFTGGIGENSSIIRASICNKLSWLGLKLDDKKNNENELTITSEDSYISAHVIQTDEESIIFESVKKFLKK